MLNFTFYSVPRSSGGFTNNVVFPQPPFLFNRLCLCLLLRLLFRNLLKRFSRYVYLILICNIL